MTLDSNENFETPDLMVSQMAWGIGWVFTTALKSLKNFALMVSFYPKHIMFKKIS